MQFSLREVIQVVCWDRGRPARNEREAKRFYLKELRACGAVRVGRPCSQY
jgi:hypothetical protein